MTNDLRQTMTSDEELINDTLSGNITSFGTLVERYWNMVVALAMSKIGEPAEAEDVAQESFLKAYSQLRSLRQPSRFAGWLSRITLQQCSNTIRGRIRCRSALGCKATGIEELDNKVANPCNDRLTAGQRHLIRERIQRLPEKFQKLIVMRFVGGLSAVQIAEQLGKRPGTVRVWLHRAYKILRKDLSPILEEVT
ncbi:MAG: sigma-70 family RNA polymerase sigma factor [Phycisphaerae bacterium]|nr:sigma-70 family RNA polymerase sigma factor [Phycisphaerae bacterium]NIP50868.1 sigma-70 family RNA polymerase sigma factor [Phycisphaerae bacterium]NIS54739.1 sigma-70 family RNA polymerase sigma factor [Phycisphaerae bacterium]NIU12339.1 sigma-70 family RNA polymerase sigma factor [Phycisphaerae bacterium]NIU60228.1 sigma-70 family RNA polymerase sigma factor [Phycisphaerae bacterium]